MEQNARGTKMIRYINAGELLEDLKHVYCLSCKKVNTFYCWNTCDVSDIINYVLSYEPADVAPVVHAHWVNHKNNYVPIDASGDVSRSAFCSNCREWLTASDEYACRGNYCPNCGAKMDEGEQ